MAAAVVSQWMKAAAVAAQYQVAVALSSLDAALRGLYRGVAAASRQHSTHSMVFADLLIFGLHPLAASSLLRLMEVEAPAFGYCSLGVAAAFVLHPYPAEAGAVEAFDLFL